MIDRNAKQLFAAGGLGDALMVANKMRSAHLSAPLTFYTDMKRAIPLIKELFEYKIFEPCYYGSESNGTVVFQPSDVTIEQFAKIKSENVIINTIWDGDVSLDEGKRQFCNTDGLIIDPNILSEIDLRDVPPNLEEYFVVQLDAGLQYHNERKHWKNVGLARQLGEMLSLRFKLKPVFIDGNGEVFYPHSKSQADIENTLTIVQLAKFVIGLSGFLTLASLMSGVPTIIKTENERVMSQYYGHTSWINRMLPITEIASDLSNIVSFVEKL